MKKIMKKIISAAISSALFVSAVSASVIELTPKVFDRTYKDYTTEIVYETFEGLTANAEYASGNKLTASSGNSQNAKFTVKSENGNEYLCITDSGHNSAYLSLKKDFSDVKTDKTVMLNFDYRNFTGGGFLAIYGGEETTSSHIMAKVDSYGATVGNYSADANAWKNIKTDVNTKEADGVTPRWINFKAFFVTSADMIFFYVDNEYIGCSDYRNAASNIGNFYFTLNPRNKNCSIDIDNVQIVNMGTKDSNWFRFEEVEKRTFSDVSDVTMQKDTLVGTYSISDGVLKMTSTTSDYDSAEQYKLGMNSSLSGYAKITFDYKVEGDGYIDMFLQGTSIGTVKLYKNSIRSTYQSGSGTTTVILDPVPPTDDGWHSFEIILDMINKRLQYVLDESVIETDTNISFRNTSADSDSINNVWVRCVTGINSTSEDFYIDNLTYYEDATVYFPPVLKSFEDGITIDNQSFVIAVSDEAAASIKDMSSIQNYISSDVDCTFAVKDNNGDGEFSDGDTVVVTQTDSGKSYVYTIDVLSNFDASAEAVIVKGTDGQGDDFCRVDSITKAGTAELTYRVYNNTSDSAYPFITSAVYDDSGRMVSVDKAPNLEIKPGGYTDFDMEVIIPSGVSSGMLKILVWDGADTQVPVLKAKSWNINTNEFVLPNVISSGMVLQRNSDVNIFGKAPEGSTVTATLSNGSDYTNTAQYTVPAGSNEFCAVMQLDGYSAENKTLTISAVDKNGESLGSSSFENVKVGDVYYGAGQSNMTRSFATVANDIKAGLCSNYKAEDYDSYVNAYTTLGSDESLKNVHYFSVVCDATASRDSKAESVVKSSEKWKEVSDNNIAGMSEVMIRTVSEIRKLSDVNDDVPVGIILCAQGGTKISKWVSKDTLFGGSFKQSELDEYAANFTHSTEGRWATHTDLYYDSARTVMPYTMKAAVWYQGEGDVGNSDVYDKCLKDMISEYRSGFKMPDMPYFIVQLAGYVSGGWTESETSASLNSTSWPLLRLAQWNANNIPNVYTVVTNDTGDNSNIHPANKDVVGERLARTVLNKLFGETSITCTGPVFDSIQSAGAGTVTIKLNTNDGNLKVSEDITRYNLFQLYDGSKWYIINGESMDNGDTIAVNGDEITITTNQTSQTITGVRYAYCPAIVKCITATYSDGAELPLAPFDTTITPNNLN